MRSRPALLVVLALIAASLGVSAPVPKSLPAEWRMLGGGPGRNMVSPNAGTLPADFDPDTDKHVLWKADLGTRCHSQPVVAGGRVFVGTNNDHPRNDRDTRRADGEVEPIDKGVLMCFDARTGKFLWQAVHDPRPATGVNCVWPREGIPSTPVVDGERVYYLNNRCEVVCADVNGYADGNQGDQTEKYTDATDADIIWTVDLVKKHGVHPHRMPACSPLVVGDTVFVVTGNGLGEDHLTVAAPDAPSLVALNKTTGELLWSDNSPGKNVMHGQWSSPAYAAEPVPQVIYGGGDGWLRAFDPKSGTLLWKFDGNPKTAEHKLGGEGTRNDFLATPVVHNGRLYVGTGQDPDHFTGPADFWCLDLKRAVEFGKDNPHHDVSAVEDCFDPADRRNAKSALAWHVGGKNTRAHPLREYTFGRTVSTVAVADGVVYVPELTGYLHCFDAATGKRQWVLDLMSGIWGSPLVADGRVYVPTESGDLYILKHDARPFNLDAEDERAKGTDGADAKQRYREAKKKTKDTVVVRKVEFPPTLRSPPTAVNGVLYVATESALYAFGTKRE